VPGPSTIHVVRYVFNERAEFQDKGVRHGHEDREQQMKMPKQGEAVH
jgi:hypothetical protein